jgi:hypothetical protein
VNRGERAPAYRKERQSQPPGLGGRANTAGCYAVVRQHEGAQRPRQREPRRITVRWNVFGIRSQRVLHLIAPQFETTGSELHSQVRQYPHREAARSWLGLSLKSGEGLGGLGEGVGEGLVPVHVRAAGAQLIEKLPENAHRAAVMVGFPGLIGLCIERCRPGRYVLAALAGPRAAG